MTYQCDDLSAEATSWMRQLMFGYGDAANPNSDSVEFLLSTLRTKLRSFIVMACESRNTRSLNEFSLARSVSNYPVALESLMKSVRVQDAMRDSSVAADKAPDSLDRDPVSRGHRVLRRIYSDYVRDKEAAKQKTSENVDSYDTKNTSRLERLERYTRNMTPTEYQKYANARLLQGSVFRRPTKWFSKKIFTKWLLEQEEAKGASGTTERNADSRNDEGDSSSPVKGTNLVSKRSFRLSETVRSSGTPSKRPRHNSSTNKTSPVFDVTQTVDGDSSSGGFHIVDLDFDECESQCKNDTPCKETPGSRDLVDRSSSRESADITEPSNLNSSSNLVQSLEIPASNNQSVLCLPISEKPLTKDIASDCVNKELKKPSADTKSLVGEDSGSCERDDTGNVDVDYPPELHDGKKSLTGNSAACSMTESERTDVKSIEKISVEKAAMERELFGDGGNDSDVDDNPMTFIQHSNRRIQPFFDSEDDEVEEIKEEADEDPVFKSRHKRKKKLIFSDSETSANDAFEEPNEPNLVASSETDEPDCLESEANVKSVLVCNRRKNAGPPIVKAIPKPDNTSTSTINSKPVQAVAGSTERNNDDTGNEFNSNNVQSSTADTAKDVDAVEVSCEQQTSPSSRYSLRSGRKRSKSQTELGNQKSGSSGRKSSQDSSTRKAVTSKNSSVGEDDADGDLENQALAGVRVKEDSRSRDFKKGCGDQNSSNQKFGKQDDGNNRESFSIDDRSDDSANSFDFKQLHVSQTADTMLYSLGCDYIGRLIDYVFHERARKWTKKAVDDVSLFHVQIQKHELEAAVNSVDFLGPEIHFKEIQTFSERLQGDIDDMESNVVTSSDSNARKENINLSDTQQEPEITSDSLVSPPRSKRLSANKLAVTDVDQTQEPSSSFIGLTKLNPGALNDSNSDKLNPSQEIVPKIENYSDFPVEASQKDKPLKDNDDVKQPMTQKRDSLLATLRTETEMVKRLTALKTSPMCKSRGSTDNVQEDICFSDSNIECPVTDTIVRAIMERLPEAASCLKQVFERENRNVKPMIATALVNLPSSASRLSLCRVLHDLSSDPKSSADAVYKVLDRLNDVPNKASRIKLVDAMVEMMKKRKDPKNFATESIG